MARQWDRDMSILMMRATCMCKDALRMATCTGLKLGSIVKHKKKACRLGMNDTIAQWYTQH